MAADGCTIVFSSTRPGLGSQDIWAAGRLVPFGPWDEPAALSELNDGLYDSDPWLAPDLRTIVYTRSEGSWRNLFLAAR